MKKLAYGLRKYLRREKARIRKTIKDAGEVAKAMEAMEAMFSRVRK